MVKCSPAGHGPPSIDYCSSLPPYPLPVKQTSSKTFTSSSRTKPKSPISISAPPTIPIRASLPPTKQFPIKTDTIIEASYKIPALDKLSRGRQHASHILGKSDVDLPVGNQQITLARDLSSKQPVSHPTDKQLLDPHLGESHPLDTQLGKRSPITGKKFLSIIKNIIATDLPPINKPSFQFQATKDAAMHNMHVIISAGSLEAAIQQQTNSTVSYGSEFRPTQLLAPLMHRHPLWKRTETCISQGSQFPLHPIEEQLRQEDLDAAISYGNHKSTTDSTAFITNMESEIKKGWALPLPPPFARELPGAEVAPHGIVPQHTINELGEIINKERVTHDQSYPGAASKQSINERVIEEDLAPCLFGHMSRRCIHYIIGCRQRHPNTKIWMSKIDWKSAYRRQHFNAKTAVKCLTQALINGTTFLLMALRLTFGGKPCPSEWGCISEPVADLATDLLHCKEWDPEVLHSPLQSKMPQPKALHESVPFAKARETIVIVPADDNGKCDVYIDDTTAIGPDINNNWKRLQACILLAIHIFCRPLSHKEPIPRDNAVAAAKMRAEGGLEEVKILLGWVFDTRRLLISLPVDKLNCWTSDILDIIIAKEATYKQLDTIIGRLNHVGYIIPTARHFLSRIRNLKTKTKFKRSTHIPQRVTADLYLWLEFLKQANKGMSMNLLTYRTPTHVYRSDACEHGLGGFSAKGRAWRWQIPNYLLYRAHINLLEFLASVICIWIDEIEGNIAPEDCLLALGDNTSSAGWLRRSNFMEDDEEDHDTTIKLLVARHLATIIQRTSSCLYSQWFHGEDNTVSDSLSRDNHLTNISLTNLLCKHVPYQLPPNFEIKPLPSKIVCWLSCLLAKLPVSTGQQV